MSLSPSSIAPRCSQAGPAVKPRQRMLQKRTKPSVPKPWDFGDRVRVPHPAVSLSAHAPVCCSSGGDTVLGGNLWAGTQLVTILGPGCPFPTSHLDMETSFSIWLQPPYWEQWAGACCILRTQSHCCEGSAWVTRAPRSPGRVTGCSWRQWEMCWRWGQLGSTVQHPPPLPRGGAEHPAPRSNPGTVAQGRCWERGGVS